MDIYTLTWDRLAAVLCLDSDHALEATPQPIRGTSSLTVIIPYEEYVRFLQSLPKEFDLLAKPPRQALETPVKSYYFDMARAVGKELYFCYKYNMRPTHFRHQFAGVTEPKPNLDWRSSEDSFRYYLEERGFPIAPVGTAVPEWAYACTLCGLSRQVPVPKWNIL